MLLDKHKSGEIEKLDPQHCMSRYSAPPLQTDTRLRNIKTSFLAITSSSFSSGSVIETWADFVGYEDGDGFTSDNMLQKSWICANEANFTCNLSSTYNLETWSIG